MLLQCPECELQVSDKASVCPHCGYPMKQNITPPFKKKPARRRRLPNGFGQISEIKNRNLKKPFRAMVTVGKTEEGKPICKILKPEGYFASYNEAYEALLKYNRNPYDLDTCITVKELYERWSHEHYKTIKPSSIRGFKAAWGYCSEVASMPVKDVRARHIKGCMESCKSESFKLKIKSLFNLMLEYALEYEVVDKNYAKFKYNNESATVNNHHIAFTDDELEILWASRGKEFYTDAVLIQCYSGWRPVELCDLMTENINLDEWTMTGGTKTKAGTNRVVPIHPKIRPIVEEKYKEAVSNHSRYLLSRKSGTDKMTYEIYKVEFYKLIKNLGLDSRHKPHDGRKTFVTLAKKYNVDEYAIKRIVGHTIDDLTEDVYTERSMEWLQSEISKIK